MVPHVATPVVEAVVVAVDDAGAVAPQGLPDGRPLMDLWYPAYIGVGSNLDDPRKQVIQAFTELATLPTTRVILTSPIYISRPFGPVSQGDFANAVVGVLTQLEPRALLAGLRALEAARGRPEQRERWGPRIIDLDVLVYGRERLADPELTLPHPGIVERNFVLYPLADIAPDLDIPGLGRVTELKGRVTPEGLRRDEPSPR
jgi:2-amino-4-hydroxy-6-hydroxymethyldihydropteridine diphosphokinase